MDHDAFQYDGFHYYGRSLLWTYQYPFSWWDFRKRREARGLRVDWFQNSAIATPAHRAFCLDLSNEFPGYLEDIWGITSPIVPTVTRLGEVRHAHTTSTDPWYPARRRLAHVYARYLFACFACHEGALWDRICQRYGFVDAFNPNTGWRAADVIGIDVGITLLGAENLRTGNVWRWFMRKSEAQRAFALTGIEKR